MTPPRGNRGRTLMSTNKCCRWLAPCLAAMLGGLLFAGAPGVATHGAVVSQTQPPESPESPEPPADRTDNATGAENNPIDNEMTDTDSRIS